MAQSKIISDFIEAIDHGLRYHTEEGITSLHVGSPEHDFRFLRDTLLAHEALENVLEGLASQLGPMLRRSITETADGGILSAIDVLFEELDEEDYADLILQLCENLGLPAEDETLAFEPIGVDVETQDADGSPRAVILSGAQTEVLASGGSHTLARLTGSLAMRSDATPDDIKAAIAKHLGLNPDDVTILELSSPPPGQSGATVEQLAKYFEALFADGHPKISLTHLHVNSLPRYPGEGSEGSRGR